MRSRPTDRQQRGKKEEPGGRQANKETNKQRTRQTKGPSARDRQTGGRKPTEALARRGPGWTHVCLHQSGSLGLVAHWVHIYPLPRECTSSTGLSTPCPLPFSLPSHAPSLPFFSQVIFLTCPSLAISGRLRHFLWALGGTQRNPASPPGMDRTGRVPARRTAPRPAEGKVQHGMCPCVWLGSANRPEGTHSPPPLVPQPQTKQTLGSGSGGSG